jgi:hypothetical protein
MHYRKEFIVEFGDETRLAKVIPFYSGKHASHKKAGPEIRQYIEFHEQAGRSKSGRSHG